MGKHKRILVIAESINVEDSSGSKANVALIQNIHLTGAAVKVLHFSRKDIKIPGIVCSEIKERKDNLNYILSRIQRKVQNSTGLNLAKYLEPFFGFSFTFFNDTKSIRKTLEQVRAEDFDVILTLSKGGSFRPHYAVLKAPQWHEKWLAYIHDPYPFFYYPEPYKWAEPGYKKHIRFFDEVTTQCRWAGFPSLLLQEWMTQYFPILRSKSLIIPHQIDATASIQDQEAPLYFKSEKFTLLHAGLLMDQRPPFSLIEGYKKFLKNNPEAEEKCQLLLIGKSSFRQKLQEMTCAIPSLYLSQGYVPFPHVQQMQKSACVNIIIEAKAEISPFLPGKFPHCIAANKPILLLGPRKSECLRLLGDSYPFWSENGDVDRVAQNIEKLYTRWENDKEGLSLNREDLNHYLSYKHLGKILEHI